MNQIEWTAMTGREWRCIVIDHKNSIDNAIKGWNRRNNLYEIDQHGNSTPTKLPYRKTESGQIEVAKDFLTLINA